MSNTAGSYYSLLKKKFERNMWICDGGEIYEFVNFYILALLEKIINKNRVRVYCDNGLVILRGANGQKKKDKTTKNLIRNV